MRGAQICASLPSTCSSPCRDAPRLDMSPLLFMPGLMQPLKAAQELSSKVAWPLGADVGRLRHKLLTFM